jgi:hypothetical protein
VERLAAFFRRPSYEQASDSITNAVLLKVAGSRGGAAGGSPEQCARAGGRAIESGIYSASDQTNAMIQLTPGLGNSPVTIDVAEWLARTQEHQKGVCLAKRTPWW